MCYFVKDFLYLYLRIFMVFKILFGFCIRANSLHKVNWELLFPILFSGRDFVELILILL